jgi:hypothetical protein
MNSYYTYLEKESEELINEEIAITKAEMILTQSWRISN